MDDMQEIEVNAANRPALKKPPSAWKVGLLYTLGAGPLMGLAAGLTQRYRNKTFLQQEAEARAEREQDYSTLDKEAAIGDEDEKRLIAFARSQVTNGYERKALGDPSGDQLIASGMNTLKEIQVGDIQQRKADEAAAHSEQRDLITTAAKGMRQENQDTINAHNAINHSAQKVLDLVADKNFDPNKPANKAVLMELLSMGAAMFKDSPDLVEGLAQGVGAFSNMAGGIVQGIGTMLKSNDFKMTPEDYNRLALNAQKYAGIYAQQKLDQLGSQADNINNWARKMKVIPEDYSIRDYVSGGEKELRLTPNPVFTGGFKDVVDKAVEKLAPTSRLPGTRGYGVSGTWGTPERPTN